MTAAGGRPRRRAAAPSCSAQHDLRLLHVGGPYDALGPWAFSLGDPVDHTPCTTRPTQSEAVYGLGPDDSVRVDIFPATGHWAPPEPDPKASC